MNVTRLSPPTPRRWPRYPLLGAAMATLVVAMWGGLIRAGWPWPIGIPSAVADHGGLMVGGFLGSLISLERAVALGSRWCYGGPVASVLGAVLLLSGAPPEWGRACLVIGSAVLTVEGVVVVRRQPALFTGVIGAGAAAWLVGNVLWASGWAVPRLVPWWLTFLVLTITGERQELSRFLPQTRVKRVTGAATVLVLIAGAAVTLRWAGVGMLVMGLGLLGIAAWMWAFDVTRRTIWMTGLPRYAAACLLSGYVWLAVGGVVMICYTGFGPWSRGEAWVAVAPMAGLQYDAILHAVFLGFVMGMIFGHAPIIFPAVLGVAVPYQPRFYAHLLVLDASLALRIAGDVGGVWVWRQWGAVGNFAAVLLFLGSTVVAVAGAQIAARRARAARAVR